MAIEDFFDDKCNIYHVVDVGTNPGYGLAASTKHDYKDIPDIPEAACHFAVKSSNLIVIQGSPQKSLDGRVKLTLPVGTDIHINDKVVSEGTGLSYIAELPRTIRNHHIAVYVNREDGVKGAI